MAVETYQELPRFAPLALCRNGKTYQVRKASRSELSHKPGVVVVVNEAGNSTRAKLTDLRPV